MGDDLTRYSHDLLLVFRVCARSRGNGKQPGEGSKELVAPQAIIWILSTPGVSVCTWLAFWGDPLVDYIIERTFTSHLSSVTVQQSMVSGPAIIGNVSWIWVAGHPQRRRSWGGGREQATVLGLLQTRFIQLFMIFPVSCYICSKPCMYVCTSISIQRCDCDIGKYLPSEQARPLKAAR